MRKLTKSAYLLIILLLLTGRAESQGLDSESLAHLFAKAESLTGVPQTLLASIAVKESSLNPWAVNIAGKGYAAKNKVEALALTKNSQGGSYDIGLMQINSWWYPRLGVTDEEIIDPGLNVFVGSLILKDCMDNHPSLVSAISCYHSGNGNDGLAYAEGVIQEWKRFSQ